ncbi:hypothetical protein [Clostridium sp. D53t1_180928_C8]|uniref:hypothetical protein n=1 Tax=Clostridium sp. D53t1_180928_C8 TaxID=2787101 RepID=UPI0018A92581|nr:hypothetical protein [Clostridium sp. D53t1_180928_C8]
MSSDIQEISNLKEVLCRKTVSRIKKKYYKAEKKVCKDILKNNEWDDEFLLKSSFVEFRKRYFNNLYNIINNIVNSSIGSIEGEMKGYIAERERCKTLEVISLIRSILDRNNIIWALHKEYIECRRCGECPEVITLVIGQQHQSMALNIFNMLGDRENGQIFVINNVRIRVAFNFTLDNKICNLTNNNIRYCILESESLPILTP